MRARKQKVTSAKVARFITDHFIETGEDITVRELATALNVSESTIRKRLEHAEGIAAWKDARPSRSHNYPMMEAGVHIVWTYGPTRTALRERCRAMEGAGTGGGPDA